MSHDQYRPSERTQYLTAKVPFLQAVANARQMDFSDAMTTLQVQTVPLITRLQDSGVMPRVRFKHEQIVTMATKFGVDYWNVLPKEQPQIAEMFVRHTIFAGMAIQFAIMDDSINFTQDDLHNADSVLVSFLLGDRINNPVDSNFAQSLVSALVDSGSALAKATEKGSKVDPNLDIYREFIDSLRKLNTLSGPTGEELDSK